jgi:hypothetical protein
MQYDTQSILNVPIALTTFRLEYHTPKENSYGSEEGNKSWSGMIGMVIKKEVEVGINIFEFVINRMEIVEFLPPVFRSK